MGTRISAKLGIIIGCVLLFVSSGWAAAELNAVILNGFEAKGKELKNTPSFSLEEEYGIKEHRYWPGDSCLEGKLKDSDITVEDWKKKHGNIYKPLDDSFLEALKKSKLLYIGQYAGDDKSELFNNPRYAEGITNFLKNGGCIFFDYLSIGDGNEFLSSLGFDSPGEFKEDYTSSSIWPGCKDMPLLNKPNSIPADPISCYGWWEKWSAKQLAPLRSMKNPEKAATLILQEGVGGKGRIITNQNFKFFRNREPLTDNILSYVFDIDIKAYSQKLIKEKGGAGDTIN